MLDIKLNSNEFKFLMRLQFLKIEEAKKEASKRTIVEIGSTFCNNWINRYGREFRQNFYSMLIKFYICSKCDNIGCINCHIIDENCDKVQAFINSHNLKIF